MGLARADLLTALRQLRGATVQLLLLAPEGPATGYQVAKSLGKDATTVYKALEAGTSDRDKVRFLYYSILSRSPTPEEMALLMRDVIDGTNESYENLTSALISTHEFIFVQ